VDHRGDGVVIVSLSGAAPENLAEEDIGGKALGLARLSAIGLPVPPAVVVPVSDEGRIEDPADVLASLGAPLAVRSSAVGEDAADRSAAGQFESVLDVVPHEVQAAVGRVVESSRSERALAYRGPEDTRIAVVIQRQVAASRAGVAFSKDPVTGEDEVLIECVFGRGEDLVAGRATPDRYRVGPSGSVQARLSPKEGPRRLLRTLRDDEARSVAEATRRAESGFGIPVDVEFCFEGPTLWLVQCRPITGLRGA
jgi:pyruvate,water dikinase